MEQIPAIQCLALELTNECQNNCVMCWAQSPKLNKPRRRGYMDYELFTRCVDELIREAPAQAKLRVALSYGGESLLHPEYDRCLKYLYQRPLIRPMIYTNGVLLWEHQRVLSNMREINVSIHRQSLEGTLMNLSKLGWRNRVTAHIVEGEFTPEEEVTITREVYKYAHIESHPQITEDLKSLKQLPGECREAYHYLAVLWDGETLPCCHILSPGEFTMGNVRDVGIYGVWEAEKYEKLRHGSLEGTPCMNCKIYKGMRRM